MYITPEIPAFFIVLILEMVAATLCYAVVRTNQLPFFASQ